MAKSKNAKLSLVIRGECDGVDKYYFRAENKLAAFFVAIGTICLVLPVGSHMEVCRSLAESLPFVLHRFQILSESQPKLACSFAIQNAIYTAVDTIAAVYLFVVFVLFLNPRIRFEFCRVLTSILYMVFIMTVTVFFLYITDTRPADPRFPGGSALMNSKFIVVVMAGGNFVFVVTLANWISLFVRLWKGRGQNGRLG